MENLLYVDLEKRSAKIKMFLLSVDDATPEQKSEIFSLLSDLDDISITSEKNKLILEMDFDFGPYISDRIWEMRENGLIASFKDSGLSGQWDAICKEAVLESVKIMYPDVVKTIRQTVEENMLSWKEA